MTSEKKGTPLWKLALLVVAGVPAMLCGVGAVGFALSKGTASVGSATMGAIHDQVAADSIEQYEMVKRTNGSAVDACVRAGLVAESFLQGKNEAKYQEWKAVEARDCEAAGASDRGPVRTTH